VPRLLSAVIINLDLQEHTTSGINRVVTSGCWVPSPCATMLWLWHAKGVLARGLQHKMLLPLLPLLRTTVDATAASFSLQVLGNRAAVRAGLPLLLPLHYPCQRTADGAELCCCYCECCFDSRAAPRHTLEAVLILQHAPTGLSCRFACAQTTAIPHMLQLAAQVQATKTSMLQLRNTAHIAPCVPAAPLKQPGTAAVPFID
jgi:hypothetical protein